MNLDAEFREFMDKNQIKEWVFRENKLNAVTDKGEITLIIFRDMIEEELNGKAGTN